MNPAIAFLCRQPNPDGLTVDRVLGMTYSELEHKHDWDQWVKDMADSNPHQIILGKGEFLSDAIQMQEAGKCSSSTSHT